MPPPLTRESGSSTAATTRATPAAISASVQGGVAVEAAGDHRFLEQGAVGAAGKLDVIEAVGTAP
jgi:hypothetical protein